MEKQLSLHLESCSSGQEKNQQEAKKGKLPSLSKESKLKPLSLEKEAQEKVFSETSFLKENTPEAGTPKKELLFENLISVKTVAEMLGLAPKTVHNWVYLRKLPFVKCGQKVMFRPKSLKAWLNRKEVKSWL